MVVVSPSVILQQSKVGAAWLAVSSLNAVAMAPNAATNAPPATSIARTFAAYCMNVTSLFCGPTSFSVQAFWESLESARSVR
jgi:hypothetical protein